MLIVLSPMFFLIALLIHTTAGRPVIVADEWPNPDGVVLRVLRFRTTGRGTLFFRDIARRLRMQGMDKLPALWNVVRGEMTLRDFFELVRGHLHDTAF